jgi:predicted small lipoprotein YifL
MRTRILCLTIAATLGALTGCGDSGGSADSPDYDVAALDVGNYPTAPRDIEASRTAASGPRLEAARIGAATPLPMEVDGRLIFKPTLYWERRITPASSKELPSIADTEFKDLTAGLVAGWFTRGQRRESYGLGRALEMYALRFTDATAAATAAARIAGRQQEVLPGTPMAIPGIPAATAKWSVTKRYLDAQLTKDTMLLMVRVEDPITEPVDTAPLAELTRRAFDKQLEGLKSYTPTPVDQLGSLPIDVDGMLSRTLQLERNASEKDNGDLSMVLAKQAALHAEFYPDLARAAFADTGVDLVTYSDDRVYRTKDNNAAERLIAAFIDQEAEGYKTIDSPPHMPGVECFDLKDPKGNTFRYPPVCYVAVDRYVARIENKNVQQLYQQVAAQYKLLIQGR